MFNNEIFRIKISLNIFFSDAWTSSFSNKKKILNMVKIIYIYSFDCYFIKTSILKTRILVIRYKSY